MNIAMVTGLFFESRLNQMTASRSKFIKPYVKTGALNDLLKEIDSLIELKQANEDISDAKSQVKRKLGEIYSFYAGQRNTVFADFYYYHVKMSGNKLVITPPEREEIKDLTALELLTTAFEHADADFSFEGLKSMHDRIS